MKQRRQQQQQHFSDFKPDEQYDPNRPNDLGEYQYYRKKLKEEKRRLAEEKKKRDEGSGESSYYSDSEDEAPRRDGMFSSHTYTMEERLMLAPKMWAPPTSIYGTQPKSVPPPPPMARAPSPPAPLASGDDAYARRVAMSQVPTGDDAYARRQAMSKAPTGDDAYAQRQAMSRPPPDLHRHIQPPPPTTGPSWNQASGDEAYARRAALPQSQHATPSPLMPKFQPPAMMMPPFPPQQAAPQNMPPFAPSQQPPSLPPFPPSQSTSAQLPPSTIESSGIPGFGVRPPSTTTTVPDAEPAVPTPAPPSAEDFARMGEERKKAAASIAERLKNLGPPPSVHPPIPEPEE
jgi:splicing factor 45